MNKYVDETQNARCDNGGRCYDLCDLEEVPESRDIMRMKRNRCHYNIKPISIRTIENGKNVLYYDFK